MSTLSKSNRFLPETLSAAFAYRVVRWTAVLLALSAPARAATVAVTVRDNTFSPPSVAVAVGDTVNWTNQGANNHTSTSGSGCTANGLWDSGSLSPGASFSFTFTSAGTFPYFCKPHCSGGMRGTVTVAGGASLSCSAAAAPASGTAPLTVNFSGSVSGGTAPYNYLWNFGDGGTSTASAVAHVYMDAGPFEWSMTVTDQSGGACFKTGTIVVSAPPSPLSCTAGATPEGGSPPLSVVFSASAQGGTTPYAYAWTFGDGGTSAAQSPTHLYASAGSFTWRMTVTDGAGDSCLKEDVIVVNTLTPQAFLSGAARATGDQGTNWRTDAMLFNPGTADLSYVLHYTAGGADGTSTPYTHAGVLNPGEAPLLTNFVETLFGLSNSAGSVRFLTGGPLLVTSRTYNDTGAGTYGQFAPGQAAGAAVSGAVRADADGELIGLGQNDRFRTNIGFSEVAGKAATALIRFFDAGGNALGAEVPVPLDPYSWAQKSLPQLGLPAADGVRAEIRVQGAGAVLAYASQVDNNTGDAVFQPAQKPADVAGVDHQFFAVIAKAQGGFGTNWLTDLVLYNPWLTAQSAGLEYRAAQGTFSASLPLAAGEVLAVTDAVASLFPGAGSNTSGSLHVRSAQGLLLASRTYNQASPTETYGQFVPALGPDALVLSGAGGNILQIINNADYRTNIGFSDFSGDGAVIAAVLHDTGGAAIASSDALTVPPGGNLQRALDSIFGAGHVLDAARVSFQVVSGGPVYGYASVADNRTGDAVFVPAAP